MLKIIAPKTIILFMAAIMLLFLHAQITTKNMRMRIMNRVWFFIKVWSMTDQSMILQRHWK